MHTLRSPLLPSAIASVQHAAIAVEDVTKGTAVTAFKKSNTSGLPTTPPLIRPPLRTGAQVGQPQVRATTPPPFRVARKALAPTPTTVIAGAKEDVKTTTPLTPTKVRPRLLARLRIRTAVSAKGACVVPSGAVLPGRAILSPEGGEGPSAPQDGDTPAPNTRS